MDVTEELLDKSGMHEASRGVTLENSTTSYFGLVRRFVHLALALALLLSIDKALGILFSKLSIQFPSALFGMFCIFSLLVILDLISPEAAGTAVAFFEPATTFVKRWLPLFYVPPIVVLPIAIKGISASAGVKLAIILVGGWMATLSIAGYTVVIIRMMTKTEIEPGQPISQLPPFSKKLLLMWTVLMGLSFALATLSPTAFGTAASSSLPFFLSATIVGYILGSRLNEKTKIFLHPIVTCTLVANLATLCLGTSTGLGYESSLDAYLTKNPNNPGAGDVFMWFLGTVILSFAFSIYYQRKVIRRHAVEIFCAIVASSLFSLYSTATIGRLLGLDPLLTRSVIPRSVTVALALPIAKLLEAQNASLTAAAVVFTGLVGSNFAQSLMNRLRLGDPIARGMATASSAHGLGTAALTSKEPEALPYCAIAYSLTGIFSTILCLIPVVRQSLIAVSG